MYKKCIKVTPLRKDVIKQEGQSHCVKWGEMSNNYTPHNRCRDCKTSRYCSKDCTAKHCAEQTELCKNKRDERNLKMLISSEHNISSPLGFKTASWINKICRWVTSEQNVWSRARPNFSGPFTQGKFSFSFTLQIRNKLGNHFGFAQVVAC